MSKTEQSDPHAPGPAESATPAPPGWADAAPAILWTTDPTGYCTYLNQNWYATTGQSPATAEGFGWLDATHPDDAERAGKAFMEANATPAPFRTEYRLRQADGSYRWCVDVGNPRFAPDGTYLGIVGAVFDIDEAKRTQDALVASEARFRAAVDAVRGVMWTNSPDGEMLGEQPGWAALTGQTRREYEGYGWADAVHPDDQRPTVDAWREAVGERRPFIFEHRVRRHDSTWRQFSVRAIPALAEDGTIREWVGVHTDITDARAAQAALRESEEHYRNAAELNPQVAWTATPDGQLDRVAERWREWTGTSGLGDGWGEGLHPDDLGFSGDAWGHAITTGAPYDVEHRVKRIDGTFRWARSRAYPRRDAGGRIVKWYGSTEDIDDRKIAEVLAFESARDLQDVVEAMPGFVWTADAQGGLQYTSPSWQAYSGSQPEDSYGSGWASFVHPDDQPEAFARWADSLVTGNPYEVEFRLRAADGHYHWWMARARRQDDGPVRWIGIATGLDDIVAARETMTRSREDLETLVAARTAELRQAEDQLRQSQKLEAIGQLTGGVAHDFNNLLTVIRGSVDLLQRPGVTEERRDRYIEAISDTVTRAAKLTGQLLAFARRQALKPDVFDVSVAVRSIADMIGTLVGSRIHIETHFPDAPCFVDADTTQFDTALVNMAVNARDAMKGEGTLTIWVRNCDAVPALRSHPRIDGRFAAISLTDTGSGMAPDRIDQIFEPFFTTKEVGQGTGLGLSQVYGFTHQSGGQIQVESTPGTGSTFTLYLPRCEGLSSDDIPADRLGIVSGEGRRVLVVEDNVEVGSFARHTLAELGYDATFVSDAAAALSVLSEADDAFDVVFSDVVMPGMNGIDLAREIERRCPALPVVLTSGYSHVLASEGTGGFDLLRKPYSMEELSRALGAARVRAQPKVEATED